MPTNILTRTVTKILSSTGVDYLWTPSGVPGSAWQSPAIDCEAAPGLLYQELTLNLAFQLAAAGTVNNGIEVLLAWSAANNTGYSSRGIAGAAGAWAPTGGVTNNRLNLQTLGFWVNAGSNADLAEQVIGTTQVLNKFLVIVLVNNTGANHGAVPEAQRGTILFRNAQVQ